MTALCRCRVCDSLGRTGRAAAGGDLCARCLEWRRVSREVSEREGRMPLSHLSSNKEKKP